MLYLHVNTQHQGKKIFKFKYKDEFVSAIYTNYPDVIKKLRDSIYN